MTRRLRIPSVEELDFSKPLVMELLFDNNKLHEELLSIIEISNLTIGYIPRIIELEKKVPKARKNCLPEKNIAILKVELWMAEKLVRKFEREKFLNDSDIAKYKETISQLKDRVSQINLEELRRTD